jgi:hypothetical protein
MMQIPFCLEPDVLHHTHAVDLHEDRFQNLIPFECFKNLAVDITDLLILLENIHPDFSVFACQSMKSRISSITCFIPLPNTEPEGKKKDEDQPKESPNYPVYLYSTKAQSLTYLIG